LAPERGELQDILDAMTSERETKLLAQRLTEEVGEVHDQGHNSNPKATASETQQNLEDFTSEQAFSRRKATASTKTGTEENR
jgi:hypothetical protein